MNYLEVYIDQFFAKPSDYAVMVRYLGDGVGMGDLEEMVGRARVGLGVGEREETGDLRVVEIIMVKELKEFLQAEKRNLQLLTQQYKSTSSPSSPTQPLLPIPPPPLPQTSAKTAILIFSSPKSKHYFLKTYSKFQKIIKTLWGSYYPKSNVHMVKGQYVSIQRAPQPDDLIWENCGKEWKELLGRRIGLYLLSFGVLGIGCGIQYLIQYIRNNYLTEQLQNTTTQYLFSLSAALIATIFNILLSLLLQFLAYHEGHDTKTQLKVAMTFRIVLFQFFNSGVFVVLANMFVRITTSVNMSVVMEMMDGTGSGIQGQIEIGEGRYGFRKAVLAGNIAQMMIVNAVMGNLLTYLINRYQLLKLYPRHKLSKTPTPQVQANKIFQPPQISIHLKYAFIFKTFWLTAFFMPMVPPVLLVSGVGLSVNYWIEKYLFSGVYAAPEAISSYLSRHVVDLLDWTLVWVALGSWLVEVLRVDFVVEDIQPEIKTLHYLFFILSILNIFLPYHAILKHFPNLHPHPNPNPNNPNNPNSTPPTYQQSVSTFQLTYEDTNPIYKNYHKKRIRDQEIFKQKLVHEVEFKEMKMRITQSQVLMSMKESMRKGSILGESGVSGIGGVAGMGGNGGSGVGGSGLGGIRVGRASSVYF